MGSGAVSTSSPRRSEPSPPPGLGHRRGPTPAIRLPSRRPRHSLIRDIDGSSDTSLFACWAACETPTLRRSHENGALTVSPEESLTAVSLRAPIRPTPRRLFAAPHFCVGSLPSFGAPVPDEAI